MGINMQFSMQMRLGIGLDIEYSNSVYHVVDTGDDEEEMMAFEGVIIKLPFCYFYYGDFYTLEDVH